MFGCYRKTGYQGKLCPDPQNFILNSSREKKKISGLNLGKCVWIDPIWCKAAAIKKIWIWILQFLMPSYGIYSYLWYFQLLGGKRIFSRSLKKNNKKKLKVCVCHHRGHWFYFRPLLWYCKHRICLLSSTTDCFLVCSLLWAVLRNYLLFQVLSLCSWYANVHIIKLISGSRN